MPWKGVDTLLSAASSLPNYHFYLVGGEKESRYSVLRTSYLIHKNIHFIGNRPHSEIPLWLKSADLLVIPNSAKTKKGSHDTSPLKLFEYLASGTPIIASDVPAIREISTHMTFFEPDNPQSLIKSITKDYHSKPQTEITTWCQRAENIMKATQ